MDRCAVLPGKGDGGEGWGQRRSGTAGKTEVLVATPAIGRAHQAFLAWREGGIDRLDWLIPVFVLTTLFTTSVGPGQTLFARLRGNPEIKRQRFWFLRYLVVSSLFYTEFKNIIARVAQLKEFSGEREWKVTPRPVANPTPETDDG